MLVQQHLFPHIYTHQCVHAGLFTSSWMLSKLTHGFKWSKSITHMHRVIYRERMHNWNMQKHHIPTLQDIVWKNVAFGGLSANQAHNISMMGAWDGIKHTIVDTSASLGSNGKHRGHIHRKLMRFMSKCLHPLVQPEADCVKIPFNILKG